MLNCHVLMKVSFFIIVSTSNSYSEHLGGTSTFSGLVIGIPTVFSGLALLPLMKLDQGMSMWDDIIPLPQCVLATADQFFNELNITDISA